MLERYTNDARTLMAFANIAGQVLYSPEIKPEHILLGLFQLKRGNAYRALSDLGIQFNHLKDVLKGRIQRGPSDNVMLGKLPNGPLTERVLEVARQYAIKLNHDYISTEHLVYGLISLPDNLAGIVLAEAGVTVDKYEERLKLHLNQ